MTWQWCLSCVVVLLYSILSSLVLSILDDDKNDDEDEEEKDDDDDDDDDEIVGCSCSQCFSCQVLSSWPILVLSCTDQQIENGQDYYIGLNLNKHHFIICT